MDWLFSIFVLVFGVALGLVTILNVAYLCEFGRRPAKYLATFAFTVVCATLSVLSFVYFFGG